MNISILTVIIYFILTKCDAVFKTTVGKRHVTVTDIGCVVAMFKGTSETNGIIVGIDSVKEVQKNGREVGTVGTSKRSFTNLTSTCFKISETTMKYPGSQLDVQNISLKTYLVIDNTINVKATLTIELIIFMRKGKVQVNGNGIKVRGGDVIYEVNVDDWPFCGIDKVVCDNGKENLTGAFLDVALSVMGQETATLKAGTTSTFNLGNGARFKVISDGSSTGFDKVHRYPELSMSAGKQLFTFRVNQSHKSAVFVLMLSLGPDVKFMAYVASNSANIVYADKANISNSLIVKFNRLEERTANDAVIKDRGHSVITFASKTFLPKSIGIGQFQNIDVNYTRFNFTMHNGAVLSVIIYLFLDNGTVINGNETHDVETGHMKFSIDIYKWPFCGNVGVATCTNNAVGDFLYFDIIVKGMENPRKRKTDQAKKGIVYDRGNWTMILSKVVRKDGTDMQMLDPYPALLQQGNKNMFRFKFPKFSNTLHYDPDLITSVNELLLQDTGSDITLSFSTLLVVLISMF